MGCAKALAVICGGLLVVALAAVTVLYFNMGPVVTWLQKEFVRKVLEATRADPGVRREVDEVFREYEEIRKKERLSFNQWRAVSRAFGQRPVVLLLGILDTRARLASLPSLSEEEREKAGKVLDRLARAVAEGDVTAEDLIALVERSRPLPSRNGEKPRAVDIRDVGREELERFIPEAEKLLDQRQVPWGPFTPDIPTLLRRDLRESLEAVKT